jgi:glycosyltransferase involved in cell wall biosynthesis
MSRPRILIVTQYFPPEMGAPQARLSELGERLIDRGFGVEALTALPNYPAGKIFQGYDPMKPVVENVGRIRTVRVPLWPSNRGFLKRIGSYFSFVGSAMLHGPRLCARPDLLFVESPPLFIACAAWYLARVWRSPYVFNVSDLWPESAVRMGVVKSGDAATRVAEELERLAYRRAAGITGQTQEIIDGVTAKVPGKPTCVVTNGVDPSRFGPSHADPSARALLGSEPGPIFIYAGLFGLAQGLDQILDAAARMPADMPGRFVLVGEGPVKDKLEERIAREKISRVRLVPAQPRERVPALLAASDVALITLGMVLPGAVPSKIYEAMASSLPIALVASGEAARRVENARAGLTVQPGDIDGLLAAIVRLASSPELRSSLGAEGRRAAETTYHRDRIADTLASFLGARLVARPP